MFLKLRKLSKIPKRFYSSYIQNEDLGLDQTFAHDTPLFQEVTHPSKYTTTTLDSGIKGYIRTGNSVISIVVDAGSRFESYESSGVSHFAQRFFFDHTNTRTKLRLVAEMQKTGANVSASNGREEIVYTMETALTSVPKLFELFTDSILNTRLHHHDLEPKKDLVEKDLSDYSGVPQVVLTENLHRVAFGEKTLGKTVLCPPHNVENISTEKIIEHFEKCYQPDRITVLGTNVEHSLLEELSKIYFQGEQKGKQVEKQESKYYGGELRLHEVFEYGAETYSVLGFKGVSNSSSSLGAYHVLASLLGDFTNDGLDPSTKGKASILYKSFGSKVVSAKAFNNNYSDAGLFGITFSGSSEAVGQSLSKVLPLLLSIKENISDQDFNRAMNQTLLTLYSSFESNLSSHEFYMKFDDKDSVVNAVKSVTKKDLQKVVSELLSSKPSLVSYGNLSKIPNLSDL